ncbi:arginase [Aureimonas sp. AU4]|uniref:arginase n=1 Tax=Aureimonas sp. AU4 TaxID=1638163 RepID=UPI00070618C4|nr:arginase [Aureimonas sp. AU4]BAT30623.1 hypothetical protein [Aureimonas sp. AU4]
MIASPIRVLDLDGSLTRQSPIRERLHDGRAAQLDLAALGPRLRLWSNTDSWDRLMEALGEADAAGQMPRLTMVGSGDFHHVTAALLARAPGPLTVVHFDNHPDWCRCFPSRHCGAWVNMALEMEHVRRVVTIGPCSDDLDRPDRKRANLGALSEGRHQVFAWRRAPTTTRFPVTCGEGHDCRGGLLSWRNVADEDFAAFMQGVVERIPTARVWITVDKDVLAPAEALTNWDQGLMPLERLTEALRIVADARRIVGADICGEYAPLRHHNPMKIAECLVDQPSRPSEACLEAGLLRNAETNRILLDAFEALL